MENGQKDVQRTLPGKKELKKQLTDKMEAALPELRALLGEKKFLRRIKKAAKILIEGLHKNDIGGMKQSAAKAATAKKSATTKAITKKAAGQKTTVAKAAPAKGAKAAKKGSSGK
ncbi:hypothetical protein FC093_22070 [Ilyomonas limi]|uniref:Histone H1 n=1 Tax=Ilyomonas limi TaxID=2575867 RepID=A0A4U3KR15_9BACT|nr:hypothetical protein [Ilyomonas limi]TKK64641.1 hypothetical protein FC093_22070 [Ilyomonas limi]